MLALALTAFLLCLPPSLSLVSCLLPQRQAPIRHCSPLFSKNKGGGYLLPERGVVEIEERDREREREKGLL